MFLLFFLDFGNLFLNFVDLSLLFVNLLLQGNLVLLALLRQASLLKILINFGLELSLHLDYLNFTRKRFLKFFDLIKNNVGVVFEVVGVLHFLVVSLDLFHHVPVLSKLHLVVQFLGEVLRLF